LRSSKNQTIASTIPLLTPVDTKRLDKTLEINMPVLTLILIYCTLVAVAFYWAAKTHGLSTGKWGAMGFFGGIASFVGCAIVLSFIQTQLIDRSIIDAPGFALLPGSAFVASALVMYLVYWKRIYPLPRDASQSRHKDG